MLNTTRRGVSHGFAALLAAVVLALLSACGGGGGDGGDGDGQIGVVPAGSVWELQARLSVEGVPAGSFDLGEVEADAIPSPQALAAATAGFAARQYSQLISGYSVSVAGNLIRLTDADTDYTIAIESFGYSDYRSCGSCALGSTVSFRLDLRISEGGRLDGRTVPAFSTDVAVVYTFTRVE